MRDTRSVSRAAARLFLSQPAVSASLNRLREAFDDPLFTRHAHGVTPTPRAQALAAQVARVLDDIGALLEAGRAFDPGASERIFRVAGSDFASRNILPALGRTLAACGSATSVASVGFCSPVGGSFPASSSSITGRSVSSGIA